MKRRTFFGRKVVDRDEVQEPVLEPRHRGELGTARRVALSTIASNTGRISPGEREIASRTAFAACWRSRASLSSAARASSLWESSALAFSSSATRVVDRRRHARTAFPLSTDAPAYTKLSFFALGPVVEPAAPRRLRLRCAPPANGASPVRRQSSSHSLATGASRQTSPRGRQPRRRGPIGVNATEWCGQASW